MGCSIVTGRVYLWSPLLRRSRRLRSAPAISRKPTRRTYSASAATTASSSPAPTKCRVCSKSPSAKRPVVVPERSDLDRLAAPLNGEGQVTILCGSGCAGAHDELLALGERLKAPMVHALRGKEYVEWDNPYDVGMTGLIGFSSGYYAMLDCDVLLMLGTDFPYRQF